MSAFNLPGGCTLDDLDPDDEQEQFDREAEKGEQQADLEYE